MPRPTYANVTSTLALFVALGGISWAAVTLPRNSVGKKQIKKGAVVSKKVKDGTLKPRDFAAGTLLAGAKGDKGDPGERGVQGERGPAGADGEPGVPGSARAYATVRLTFNSGFAVQQSKNATVTPATNLTGAYCIALAFDDPKAIVATPVAASQQIGATIDETSIDMLTPANCPEGTDAFVATATSSGSGEYLAGFSVLVE